jgi:hypothetical protein
MVAKTRGKNGDVWETFGNSILLLSYLVLNEFNISYKGKIKKKNKQYSQKPESCEFNSRHNITGILLKAALNTKPQPQHRNQKRKRSCILTLSFCVKWRFNLVQICYWVQLMYATSAIKIPRLILFWWKTQ